MNAFLTTLGALELVILVGLALFALACWAVRLNARLEEQRRLDDLADLHAQLAAMTADETSRWNEWVDDALNDRIREGLAGWGGDAA
ncbi:MAG: hypothetical protein HOQ18_18385 [Dermatophilaceae bacterium]|nr:hypothetical protein [Dermatophilaceae bacterium]NUO92770.1 hypothetical protein [Dermatophilaceae bacterium]